MSVPWVEIAGVVINVAGWLHAAHALMRARTAEGTIAWVMCLIVLPFIAIPLYWVLGRSRFRGYVLARRAKDGPLATTFLEVLQTLAACEHHEDPPHPLLRPSAKLSGLPVTTGNDLELLAEGGQAFERMFEDIGKAKFYVLVLFFIVKSDDVGQRFKEALIERAKAGVRVFLLFDEFGSRKLPESYIESLIEAGVRPIAFSTQLGKGNRFQINFRNHRKIIVIDGHVAFSGGMNIGDEYTGVHTELGVWRDTLVRIEGPAVQCMQLVFVEDWNWATGAPPEDLIWEPPDLARCKAGRGARTLVLPTSPADALDSCHLFFLEAIAAARRRIWITSPYFVPDRAIVAALQAAAVRGVDVRILLPNDPDHLLVYLSSFSFLHEMDLAGVGVYRYENGFLHQKVMLIDQELASVGTANFDNRSFRLNFEIITLVQDQAFASEVEAMLDDDFSHSRQVTAREYTQKPVWFRIGVRLARLMTPIQ
jgi:cardiolipin synthase